MAMKSYNYVERDVLYGQLSVNSRFVSGLNLSPIINGSIQYRYNPLGSLVYTKSLGNKVKLSGGRYVSTMEYGGNRAAATLGYPLTFDNSLVSEASWKFHSKITEMSTNVLTLLAERREAANMVINRIRQLTRAARHGRRGRWDLAAKTLKTALKGKPEGHNFSGQWLEFSYGWAPLLQDVYNLLDKGFGNVSGHVRATVIKDVFEQSSLGWAAAGVSQNRVDSVVLVGQHKCTITGTVVIDNTALAAASQWGLTNPALTAWELVPWSFAIDWFLPIGDYLDMALRPHGVFRIVDGGTSKVTKQHLFADLSFRRWANDSEGIKRSVYTSRYFSLSRTQGIPPLPLPTFKSPLSFSARLLNQLALLRQAFK